MGQVHRVQAETQPKSKLANTPQDHLAELYWLRFIFDLAGLLDEEKCVERNLAQLSHGWHPERPRASPPMRWSVLECEVDEVEADFALQRAWQEQQREHVRQAHGCHQSASRSLGQR